MFLPIALYVLIFAYIPISGIVIAFKNYNYTKGILFSDWNGFENFRYIFASGSAWLVTKNTIMYNLIFIIADNLFAIVAAICIAEMVGKYFKKIAQTFMFLPYFVSWVTVAAFMNNLFGFEYGIINNILRSFNMNPIDIYSNSSIWVFILPLLHVWKGIGFSSVIYISAIMGIDQECYESAKLDGADVFQEIWHITLPMLKPTIIILVLLGIGRIMRGEFDMFFQIVGSVPNLFNSTDIIDTLVFRSLVLTPDFGMASATGVYQSVLCFIIINIANFAVRKYEKDYALF